jgi:hypothetical protein
VTLAVRHFYHLCTDRAWEDVAAEHCAALAAAGWPYPVTVGLIGDSETRAEARGWWRGWCRGQVTVTEFLQANRGYEEQTLWHLREWAREQDGPAAVLYMHAKGTYNRIPLNHRWRRQMTEALLSDWPRCLDELTAGDYDVIGPYWVTPGQYPGVPAPHFSGNFWVASAAYLADLPEPLWKGSRFDAEIWIGLGQPRIRNLLPGWPPDIDALPPAAPEDQPELALAADVSPALAAAARIARAVSSGTPVMSARTSTGLVSRNAKTVRVAPTAR